MGNVIGLKIEENPDAVMVTFEEFWKIYPRRVAKKDAERAWAKISPEHYPAIMRGIERHKKSEQWRESGGKFIPFPATYLNGERWEDELDADITMGQCAWNINGNRDGEVRCTAPATTEKRGIPYCAKHAARVNP